MSLLEVIFYPYFAWKKHKDEESKLIAAALKELAYLESFLDQKQIKSIQAKVHSRLA